MSIGIGDEIKHHSIYEMHSKIKTKSKEADIPGFSLDSITLELENGDRQVIGFMDSSFGFDREKRRTIITVIQCSLDNCFDECEDSDEKRQKPIDDLTIKDLLNAKIEDLNIYTDGEKDADFELVDLKIYGKEMSLEYKEGKLVEVRNDI